MIIGVQTRDHIVYLVSDRNNPGDDPSECHDDPEGTRISRQPYGCNPNRKRRRNGCTDHKSTSSSHVRPPGSLIRCWRTWCKRPAGRSTACRWFSADENAKNFSGTGNFPRSVNQPRDVVLHIVNRELDVRVLTFRFVPPAFATAGQPPRAECAISDDRCRPAKWPHAFPVR